MLSSWSVSLVAPALKVSPGAPVLNTLTAVKAVTRSLPSSGLQLSSGPRLTLITRLLLLSTSGPCTVGDCGAQWSCHQALACQPAKAVCCSAVQSHAPQSQPVRHSPSLHPPSLLARPYRLAWYNSRCMLV